MFIVECLANVLLFNLTPQTALAGILRILHINNKITSLHIEGHTDVYTCVTRK